MNPIKKADTRDSSYAKKGNYIRDLSMLRQWVKGEAFKDIGRLHGCRASLVASTCRRLSARLIEINQWEGIHTKGKYDGSFPKETQKDWLNAINKFEKQLTKLIS